MDNILLLLLFVVALALGYGSAKLQQRRFLPFLGDQEKLKDKLQVFFKLEDDKEIAKLVESLEVSKDTFSIHMAIGTHYRKKGEVEKAISLHQNLLGSPELNQSVYGEVLLELAKDYMLAGLLDRAESLLLKLIDQKEYKALAIKKLMDIYQQEKEWQKAITLAQSVEVRIIQSFYPMLAQFCCEVAYNLLKEKEYWEAKKEIKKALDYDKSCVRALLLLSDIHAAQGIYNDAVSVLKKVVGLEVGYLSEIGFRVCAYVDAGYDLSAAIKFLRKVYSSRPSLSVALVLAELLNRSGNMGEAVQQLERQLVKEPSVVGLVKMIDFYKRASLNAAAPIESEKESHVMSSVSAVCDQLGRDLAAYKCDCCGFEAKSLYWLCPSCRQWSSIKSVLDVDETSGPYLLKADRRVS